MLRGSPSDSKSQRKRDDMTAPITALLAQIEAPGTFATRLRAPAGDLEIEVKGVGPLKFPITARLAQKLRNVARPSPFGLREQTLQDPSVRNTWEVAGSRVKIAARRWKPVLATYLRTLQTDLGFPDECEVEAVFDKLLIYEKGQFFKPHQDSEKDDEMVGTLVVILPSQYEGGAMTVEHRGEKKVFRRVESQAKHLSLLGFYADCHHAVSPIKSGVRVALTYQLRLAKRSKVALPKVRADLIERLTGAVREYLSAPIARRYGNAEPAPPERLVYLLDHEYTQRSLSWSHLKNGDRARVAALRAAAERLDCECFLSLAEVHETWLCEDDYPRRRYGRRGWHFGAEGEASESDEYELIELQNSNIELNHWLDVAGKHVGGLPAAAREDELHFTKPSRDMDPFKSEHEGYQGNYGNTVDRWYHRAAFVMWPRTNGFAIRAQASPRWAVGELLALPRTGTADLESRVRSLLPRWRRTAGSIEGVQFFASLVKLSARIEDAALAREWLAPLGLHRLTSKQMRRGFAALIDKHGLPWARELLTEWGKRQHWGTPAYAPLLAELCADLRASNSKASEALANCLLDREVKAALDRCVTAFEGHAPWLDLESLSDEARHLAHVLAAGAASSAHQVITGALDTLLGAKQTPPLSFLLQLLEACLARSPALEVLIVGSDLHRECARRVGAILRAPARAEGDWSITYPLRCACADCKGLEQFLSSGGAERDWPLSKDRRQHIHQTIDSARLPVLHTTLRRGSPHVLQLRKDRSLFTRERAYRARVKQIFEALPPAQST